MHIHKLDGNRQEKSKKNRNRSSSHFTKPKNNKIIETKKTIAI